MRKSSLGVEFHKLMGMLGRVKLLPRTTMAMHWMQLGTGMVHCRPI